MPRDVTPPAAEFRPAIRDYTLVRVIGAGSYGHVWLARSATGTFRAIKVVRRDEANEGRDFARAFKGLQHYEPVSRQDDSLMDVLHVGIVEAEGYFYCVMELADPAPPEEGNSFGAPGTAVAEIRPRTDALWDPLDPVVIDPDRYEPLTLRLIQRRQPRLPAAECVGIGIALCRALGALHGHGLVHRDIKPSNIIFARGRPKLADIDLVSPAEGSMRRRVTEGYTAPEGAGSVAADLYSLGKVLYEISTGRDRTEFPAPAEDLAPEESSMWADLNDVLLRACEEDPRRRHRSAREMHDELCLVQAGRSVRRLRLLEHRQRVLVRAGAVLLIVGLLSMGALLRERHLGHRLREAESQAVRSLVQLHVANGRRALEDDTPHHAALWFARALQLAREEPILRELRHRIEILLGSSPRLVGMGAHEQSITEVVFHPDGRRFATASDDGSVRFWDSATGAPVGGPLRHDSAVNDVKYSPDGGRLATACLDGTVQLWEAPWEGAASRVLRHGREVYVVGFSPDGRLLLSGGQDGWVRLWEVASGREWIPAIRHEDNIRWAAFSPDGRWVVTASRDGTVGVWSSADGTARFPPLRHPQPVEFAAFSPDGERLLTACRDGIARFWRAADGIAEELEIRHERLNYAGFSHDGTRVVTTTGGSSEAGEVRIWSATTGQPEGPPLRHSHRVRYAEFSPDDRWLATAGHDGVVQVVRVGEKGPAARLTLGDRTWALAFDSTGTRLVTAGREKVWRLWELRPYAQAEIPSRQTSPETRAHLTRDGRWIQGITELGSALFRAGPGGLEKVAESRWDATETIDVDAAFDASGNHVLMQQAAGTLLLLSLPEFEPAGLRIPPNPGIVSAALGADGRTVLVGTRQGTIHIWRALEGGWTEEILQAPFARVTRVVPAPAPGIALVCGTTESGEHGGFAIARLGPEKALLGAVRWQTQAVWRVPAFSRDSRRLAVGFSWPRNRPTTVSVVDVPSNTDLCAPLPQPDSIGTVAFSPEGSVLYVAGTDGVLRSWGLRAARAPFPPQPHGAALGTVAVSTDGHLLATGAGDGTARLSSGASGEMLSPRLRHAASVHTVAFTADDRRLLTMSGAGEVRLYSFPRIPEEIARLRDRVELEACAEITEDGRLRLLEADALLDRWRRIQATSANAPGGAPSP